MDGGATGEVLQLQGPGSPGSIPASWEGKLVKDESDLINFGYLWARLHAGEQAKMRQRMA